MRFFSRCLLGSCLLAAFNALAWDFNNNFYAAYQRSESGGGSTIYAVPRQSVSVETKDLWPLPLKFMPDMPGLTIVLDGDGSVTGFSANTLTADDMAGLGAAPSAYALTVDDVDGDGKRDLLLKNAAGRTLVVGTDHDGSPWISSTQALSRARYSIGPDNVLVVYDIGNSHVSDPAAVAEQYRLAREIPVSNLLAVDFTALTGVAATAQACSRAQVLPLVSAVKEAIASSGRPIRAILFIGDFPARISDVFYDTAGHYIGFFDAFLSPSYFSTVSSGVAGGFSFPSLGALYWRDDALNYPSPVSPWHFNTVAGALSGTIVNPLFNPVARAGEGYAVFNMPLNVLSDPSLLWSRAISAEQARYSDWGTVVLYGGSDRNPTSRHFLEEARYEGHSLGKFHWAYLNTTTETGLALFPSALADSDPGGFTLMPGDAAFSAGTIPDLFFISPGVRSYYDISHSTETIGDYHYRSGAIALFGQSFGATPATTDYLGANKVPALLALAATPVQSTPTITRATVQARTDFAMVPFDLLTFSYSGDAGDNALLRVRSSGGIDVIEATGPVGESFDVPVTQSNLKDFLQAVQAAVSSTSRWNVALSSGATQRFMSRAAAALAAGATVAVGAGAEPLSNGDPNTYALFTTLWYGGNLAEWQLRQRAGFRPDNNKVTNLTNWLEMPVALVVYGDPLYAPFRWRAQRGVLGP